ncbi:MAG: HAD hydrolase-like protein [Deltaproteobacteria bacterium]|jgi:phosphoglycolate phosphatase-like HAD superfamily hydrolase|nr:HAD hydrolase-like protein [Deltaproteobacteria bacterium]
MKSKKLIVFDMDGVLIDVSGSYRETVRQTAGLFFKPAPSAEKLPDPLFPLEDLATVKQSGGLNNDWDLSCRVISLLFNVIEKPPLNEDKDPWNRYRETIRRCHVAALAEYLNSTPMPLSALLHKAGKARNAFIEGLYSGDVGSGNIIKQIFQEVYLGKDLFEATYGLAPQFYFDEGYNHREQLLVDRHMLAELTGNHILAIATGRPRAEADYPLDYFGIRKYFTMVMALEDCLEEEARLLKTESKKVSLSKPDPFMLDAIAERCKHLFTESYYIGDMPDDMIAAGKSAGGYRAVGMILSAPDQAGLKKELERAGADFIIEDFQQLKDLVQRS